VPRPQEYQSWGIEALESFVYARAGYLVVVLIVLFIALFLVQRAYRGAWGRMMRAIRDNHVAAGAMGKDVKSRQLEIFVLGCILIGVGGGILTSFTPIFDPSGYQPLNHTFIVWVMVIIGGAGNNFGTIFGAIFIYIVWLMSEPASQVLFTWISDTSVSFGWPPIPDIDSRALQMRVFVLGLVITFALRYAPQGLIPEIVRRDSDKDMAQENRA
jgi:branched-chain amino acid transport system permease protein